MCTQYRVDMFPLEPYTFGTEQGSRFKNVTPTGKESYIIASGQVPEQTTVLGTLRYLILQEKDLLKPDFRYGETEREKVGEAVGKDSFSFQKKTPQSFGVIKKLSPLFLTKHCREKKEPEIYIKNPFNNKRSDGGYDPMKLTEETFVTSHGEICLLRVMDGDKICPEYDAKAGHGSGYICLSEEKEAAPGDLFSRQLLTGNRIRQENDSEGVFKREAVALKKGFAFSIFLELEEDLFPEKDGALAERIAFMGRKKSAFRFRFTKMKEKRDLAKMVEQSFAKEAGCWQYALSDLYFDKPLSCDGFAIIAQKCLRTLHTDISEDKYVDKRKKSEYQFCLIESGSVFCGNGLNADLEHKNAEKIGYNAVVSLGGK